MLISGNLHFTNIRLEDGQDGRMYVCIVENSVAGLAQQGDYVIIETRGGMSMERFIDI